MSMVNGLKGASNVGISQCAEAILFFLSQGVPPEEAVNVGSLTAMFTSHKAINEQFAGLNAAQITENMNKMGSK
ncbi:hypothetical protein [Proteus faecis]|uniref:hypothetical protein n=1 Tax=Proteus faecis TaxID=2050967 RepID=UPI0021BB9E07|nr:hypothetical protein [Proteus faecis]MCT8248454.1 hypothetical protein [Proteus faecis]